jgi:hypothetical protein
MRNKHHDGLLQNSKLPAKDRISTITVTASSAISPKILQDQFLIFTKQARATNWSVP